MTRGQEYVFGIKRYLKKAVDYLNRRSMDEFLKDDMAFDAMCFVIKTISELAQDGAEYTEVSQTFDSEDLNYLSSLSEEVFLSDNISLDKIYEFASFKSMEILLKVSFKK